MYIHPASVRKDENVLSIPLHVNPRAFRVDPSVKVEMMSTVTVLGGRLNCVVHLVSFAQKWHLGRNYRQLLQCTRMEFTLIILTRFSLA